MGLLDGVGDFLSGTSGDAGALGVGQFKGKAIDINEKAFDEKESEARQRLFAKQLKESQARSAPKLGAANQVNATQINQAPQAEFRGQQSALAAQLAAQAQGQGPSLAQSQLRQATDRNIQQAMALAASQRGSTPGQGLRAIAQTAATANQQAAQQSSELRAQEQLAAQQNLAGVLSGARGQDIGLATDQAQLGQQASLANQQALNQFELQQAALAQQQSALNDAQARFYNQGLSDMDQRDREAAMALEKLKVDQNLGISGVNQQGYASASQARGDLVGNIGAGVAAAFSDENLKKDVKPGENKTQSFLEAFSSSLKGTQDNGKKESGQSKLGMAIGKGLGSLMGGGGSGAAAPAAAMSDEKVKEDLGNGDEKLKAFLNSLKAYEYQYKNPQHGEGTHVSPMAQDIEKTDLGKSLVTDTPEGKMVNYAKAGGVMLASAAMLNDRVDDLESRLKKAFSSQKRSA